jgi:mRNA interferase RelE/StbE
MKSKPDVQHKYRLKFIPAALDEWNTLDGSIKDPLRKALK